MNESKDSQYRRVQQTVLDDIYRKRWGHGDRLPSESELARELAVSRSTVSRVMARLRYAGLIVGPAGGPACVTDEPMWSTAFKLFEDAARVRKMNRDRGLASPE